MKQVVLFLACAACAALSNAAPAPDTKPAGQAPAGGAPAHGGQKEAPPANGFDFKFDTPEKKSYADFPSVELRAATSATYIGLQFGTGKTDVAYICFDTVDPKEIHDRAYVHIAGSTNKPFVERGHNVEVKRQKNVKIAKEKPQRFEFPPIRTKIGDNDVAYRITCVYGHDNKANLHLTAEAVIKGKSSGACALHANLSNFAVPAPNEIKVIPLLGKPAMHIYPNTKVNPPVFRPFIGVSESVLLEPQKGMDNSFTVEIRQKGGEGKVAEKGKLPIKIPEYSGLGDAGAGDNYIPKISKPGDYEVIASIHLGPLGEVSGKTTIPVAPKSKAK